MDGGSIMYLLESDSEGLNVFSDLTRITQKTCLDNLKR